MPEVGMSTMPGGLRAKPAEGSEQVGADLADGAIAVVSPAVSPRGSTATGDVVRSHDAGSGVRPRL